MRNEKRVNRWYFGGISSATAVCVTHPLDVIKVQLQTQLLPRKTIVETVEQIYAAGGIKGLYRGMSASLFRQLTYSTTRFGIYESGKQYFDSNGVFQTLALASIAGVCGGVVGVPSDMVNVRMQNDLKLPKENQRRYKNVFDGFQRVVKEEGIAALFRGGSVAVLRGIFITIGQNVCYDHVKDFLLRSKYFKDNTATHLFTSLIAGGVTTLLTQPMDVMKTRLMNAKPGTYSGIVAVAKEIAGIGPMTFYKGLTPSFLRIGPHTVLTFITMEQLRLYFGYLPPTDAI